MSRALFRRNALRSAAAAIAACSLVPAQYATATPVDEPNRVQVPHFGHGKVADCVPRARDRIKAVMNGASMAQFDNPPPGRNRPCK